MQAAISGLFIPNLSAARGKTLAGQRGGALNCAATVSNHPAARIFRAVLPHFGQVANQSPGINASLRGAMVFFQLQSSHTNVKGLGFIGMDVFP
ncbi:hypothetical protein [Pseudomonas grimontii]|uniref:hypothetical protein n=1 Tax=Pseudomonas grimontii TaxID=129847 RepID=UPI0028EEF862|nr:hypothetical protein [Pseudomonas grimontii]